MATSIQKSLEHRPKHGGLPPHLPEGEWRENGGLQVKLPLVTLFDSMWGNLERCHQFDDGTRRWQMMILAY